MQFLGNLKYFHMVSRLRSIRKAAEALHVAQSAVSRQIKNLEDEVGVPLFDRHARGVRLTEAGEVLARYAHRVVLDLEHARSQIEDLRALRRGTVGICTVEAGVADILPRVIDAFQRRHPAVKVAVLVRGTQGVVETLQADDADIGLAFNAPDDPSIKVLARREQRLNAVLLPTHPLARRKQVTLAELAAERVALPDSSFGIRHLVDEIQRKTRVALEPVLLTNSIQALVNFARLGMGVTFLPYFAVEGAVSAGTLAVVPLADAPARAAAIEVIVHEGRKLPIAAEEFAAALCLAVKRLH